ncbi:threonine/serine exporter family protein [Desulfuribacillus alkaliarsenatis]|uniref:Threonine/serine exporter-like N-terminal domain-containing protein n=1 Tax=Desulfuribacillus alkaliarsenatis TaxID=766136 RepID=A0A1E5FYX2_9FIRM|nr:threonine/serine exporter family protein [Desulfuribacillus alkaliarsenatis]OEF95772.1 hypothetical protein BHF68_11785 [Desulfuribacillus alkaliarsenatis]
MSINTTIEKYDFDKTMELCQLAGKIMLYSGGETYRVEDTIIRVANACGLDAESYVTPTGIFITLYDGAKSQTSMTRLNHRTIDLNKVSLVNGVSRELSTGVIDPQAAYEKLKEIFNAPLSYSKSVINVWAGVASGSFAYLFGGTLPDVIIAGFTGAMVNIILNHLLRYQASIFLATFLAAINAGLLSVLAVSVGIGQQLNTIVIGGIMPLLPGVALTNAVRDMIAGDLVSGVTRAAEAVLIAAAIAAGIIVILALVI